MDPQAVFVYDNMNFKDTTRHEVVGHKAQMRHVTTAAVVLCPELPLSGLRQDMHNPSIPLSVKDILLAPGICGDSSSTDETGWAITRSLITDAVCRVHPAAVDAVFKADKKARTIMPVLDIIQAQKTQYWQYGGIFRNEGTVDGTYGVHDDIFVGQSGLRAPSDPSSSDADDFKDVLRLVHGDQLSAQLMRSVKHEQARAERPYDRRTWLLPVPAWFHVQLNLLMTIVRTHWKAERHAQHASHTIQADIQAWGRSQTSRDNAKYHLLEPIVAQGFTGRVVALFYQALATAGHLTEDVSFENQDAVGEVVSGLSTDQFNHCIDQVRLVAFTMDAWNGTGHQDVEFKTMCRMLQEIETFLIVRQAVKRGDIGLLRRMVDPLIVLFFGSGQYNYGREMLYYRWQLSPVNTPELQRAILASGLVNWPGRSNSHKPIDLSLEHLNCGCKIEMQCYKNSTHDVDMIFDRVCLCNTWIRNLRQSLESVFGVFMPDAHIAASAVLDMFSLARRLLASDLAAPRSGDLIHGEAFESVDVLQNGVTDLHLRVETFNKDNVRIGGLRTAALVSEEFEGDLDVIDIDDFVDTVDEIADREADPAVDWSTVEQLGLRED